MKSNAHDFQGRVEVALHDPELQKALGLVKEGFIGKRAAAVAACPEFESLRAAAREVKEHTLSHLDFYLERYEQQVIAAGGQVHWARTPAEARDIVIGLCRAAGAKRVTKGKSMVGEEIGINEALEAAGMEPIETDLGEYIIQLAEEPPSHIIAPAIHKTRNQVTELFYKHHQKFGYTERVTEVGDIVDEARKVLREGFLTADVGITGANFLVAETGSNVIVTNEGNGDLTNTLPRVHIVTASIEKVVPTLEACREVSGCEISAVQGQRREGDPPELVADPTLAKQVLGWQPAYTDLQGIIETAWRWHREHPNGYSNK